MTDSTGFHSDDPHRPLASTSVRITRREYMRLISQLDGAAGPAMPASSAANRRTQFRIPFHREARLFCEWSTQDGRPWQYLVRCRNLCKRGLAFLHEAPIEAGTRCEMTVMGCGDESQDIAGVIMRSRRIAEHVYEIGVRFNHPVDLSEFIAPRSNDGVIPLPAARDESRRAAV